MCLNTPASKPPMDQKLYALSAAINGTITAAELPKSVRDLQMREGRIAEFAVDVDFSSRKRLDESVANLRQLADVLSAAAHIE